MTESEAPDVAVIGPPRAATLAPADSPAMRILLAEDEDQLRDTLARGLREHAYAVDTVADGDDAVYQAAVTDYDAVILDVLMPKRSGLDVCREIRRRRNHVPILMLTARDALADRVTGLD